MMRAKMVINSIERTQYGEKLSMSAVCSNETFGPEGESENNTFARFTPSAELTMTITNPDLHGKFNPGEEYYLDFTKAK